MTMCCSAAAALTLSWLSSNSASGYVCTGHLQACIVCTYEGTATVSCTESHHNLSSTLHRPGSARRRARGARRCRGLPRRPAAGPLGRRLQLRHRRQPARLRERLPGRPARAAAGGGVARAGRARCGARARPGRTCARRRRCGRQRRRRRRARGAARPCAPDARRPGRSGARPPCLLDASTCKALFVSVALSPALNSGIHC